MSPKRILSPGLGIEEALKLYEVESIPEYWEDVGGPPSRPTMAPPDLATANPHMGQQDALDLYLLAASWFNYACYHYGRAAYEHRICTERADQVKAFIRPGLQGNAADKADKLRTNPQYMVEKAKVDHLEAEKKKYDSVMRRMDMITGFLARLLAVRKKEDAPGPSGLPAWARD